MKRKIYFRADGHTKMGLGHVIRSLALADMLKEEFECHFIIRNPLPTLRKQILEVCKSIITLPDSEDDIEEVKQITETYLTGDEIVVLDGYHFITEYQQVIKSKGCKVVCIDDIYASHFVADIVINHAPGLRSAIYSGEVYTRYCLGLDYSLLRKPFLDAALKSRKISQIKKVFICFGGADFNNVTIKVLKAIAENKSSIEEAHVVLGGANDFKNEVKAFVSSITTLDVKTHENLSAQEMVSLMEYCHLAIVPASSILYEITSVKMPVISGYYVDNQINVHKGFKDLGLIYSIGNFNEFEDYNQLIEEIVQKDTNFVLALQSKHQTGKSKEHFLEIFQQL